MVAAAGFELMPQPPFSPDTVVCEFTSCDSCDLEWVKVIRVTGLLSYIWTFMPFSLRITYYTIKIPIYYLINFLAF